MTKVAGRSSGGLFFLVGCCTICKHIKRLAIGGIQLTIFPRAVRNYEIEKPAFFAWILFFEQLVGSVGQFQEFDTFFKVYLVCVLVFIDGPLDFVLIASPLLGLTVKKVFIDPL